MTEPTEATATEPQTTTTEPEPNPKPTETVEFWKAKAREQEKRAKENAEAARRLTEIEDSKKSEVEKANDRVKQAEAERDAARVEALRSRVAVEFGISGEDADLFLTGADEATMRKQAERLAARAGEQRKQGNHVPREGTKNPIPGESDERQFARNLFSPA